MDYYETREIVEGLQRQRSDISDHLETLRFIVREFDVTTAVELGVQSGCSTLALLLGIRETGPMGGVLLSIDRDPCESAKAAVKAHGLDSFWQFVQCNALAKWGELNVSCDLLFVDLDHTYEETKTVLELWSGAVTERGFIVFHDTVSRPGVLKARQEFIACNDGWRPYHWLNNNGLMVLRRAT